MLLDENYYYVNREMWTEHGEDENLCYLMVAGRGMDLSHSNYLLLALFHLLSWESCWIASIWATSMTKVSVISLILNRDSGQEIGCPSHVCEVSTKWVELLQFWRCDVCFCFYLVYLLWEFNSFRGSSIGQTCSIPWLEEYKSWFPKYPPKTTLLYLNG